MAEPAETEVEAAKSSMLEAAAERFSRLRNFAYEHKIETILLSLLLLSLVLHVAFDRFTPYTSEAFLNAPVIGIAPSVSGTIVDVAVQDNQQVKAGDVLFRIDSRRFAAAVDQSEAALANASQQVGANTASLAAATAHVAEANADLMNQREQSERVLSLVKKGVYASAQGDTAKFQLARAEAAAESATASLEEARQKLGSSNVDNPQIRQALAQLERARIELVDSEVLAPVDGTVTNSVISVGQFVSAGHRAATIVDTASAWITANIPENALTRIRPGDRVAVTFNVHPGSVFEGRVESIASGVSQSATSALPSDLALVPTRRTWLRDTQRIPVRIEMVNWAEIPAIRTGSRANVVIHTQSAGIWSIPAGIWLRMVSIANYVF
jgi:multidrug resistance efflux pump